jgi:hypothetical protein
VVDLTAQFGGRFDPTQDDMEVALLYRNQL